MCYNEMTWIQPRQCLRLSTPGHVSRCLDVSALAGSLRGSGNQLRHGRLDSSEGFSFAGRPTWIVTFLKTISDGLLPSRIGWMKPLCLEAQLGCQHISELDI